tara:strand:- start:2764 stop:3438 length:675 start_codon:yes stop_codon:yes gene_type:complete
MLELSNISQEYKQGNTIIKVLDNLNFKSSMGNKIGIIGPSGSGKSTLLNIIGLLESPKKGEILISNIECTKLKPEQQSLFRKENIGFIFQNNQLLEDFNVEENVALPLILNGKKFNESIEEANKLLQILGISNRNKFKPNLLSGGEQQRVAVARALIKKPLLILADEPTGSLDDENSSDVLELILKMSKINNSLCIVATHNLKLINNLDFCMRIEEGKLVENRK